MGGGGGRPSYGSLTVSLGTEGDLGSWTPRCEKEIPMVSSQSTPALLGGYSLTHVGLIGKLRQELARRCPSSPHGWRLCTGPGLATTEGVGGLGPRVGGQPPRQIWQLH